MTSKKSTAKTTKSKKTRYSPEDAAKELLKHPEEIGKQIGFEDLTPLHGMWIREIVFGTEDYTL